MRVRRKSDEVGKWKEGNRRAGRYIATMAFCARSERNKKVVLLICTVKKYLNFKNKIESPEGQTKTAIKP